MLSINNYMERCDLYRFRDIRGQMAKNGVWEAKSGLRRSTTVQNSRRSVAAWPR